MPVLEVVVSACRIRFACRKLRGEGLHLGLGLGLGSGLGSGLGLELGLGLGLGLGLYRTIHRIPVRSHELRKCPRLNETIGLEGLHLGVG